MRKVIQIAIITSGIIFSLSFLIYNNIHTDRQTSQESYGLPQHSSTQAEEVPRAEYQKEISSRESSPVKSYQELDFADYSDSIVSCTVEFDQVGSFFYSCFDSQDNISFSGRVRVPEDCYAISDGFCYYKTIANGFEYKLRQQLLQGDWEAY